jgi:IclR family pca regulon transcriptional regulator
VYVARASTKRVMSISLSIGSRLPAYCTSMGRCLLATLPDASLVAYLDRTELRAITPKTIVDKTLLRDIIRNVASTGFALTDEELELGLRSIAVPVRARNRQVVAAMNIGVPAARLGQGELIRNLLPLLRVQADRLGSVLT